MNILGQSQVCYGHYQIIDWVRKLPPKMTAHQLRLIFNILECIQRCFLFYRWIICPHDFISNATFAANAPNFDIGHSVIFAKTLHVEAQYLPSVLKRFENKTSVCKCEINSKTYTELFVRRHKTTNCCVVLLSNII